MHPVGLSGDKLISGGSQHGSPSGNRAGLFNSKERGEARLQSGTIGKPLSVNPSTLVRGAYVDIGALSVLGFAAAPSWYFLMGGKRGQIGSLLTLCAWENTPDMSSENVLS